MHKTHFFAQQFIENAKSRSPFCLGIDPSPALLEAWHLSDTLYGLEKMCEIIIEASASQLAIIKPQSAYFERFGPEGGKILQKTINALHAQNSLILMDVKRGDIGPTSLAYAHAYLGSESPYKADAITVTSYLGFDALTPLLDFAATQKTGVFIVIASSNPEGYNLQNAIVEEGVNVMQMLASSVMKCNSRINNFYENIGPVGAVIGATLSNTQALCQSLASSLLLMPGIGFQGASIKDLRHLPFHITSRIIPTSSREILSKGPDIKNLRYEIEKNCHESFMLYEK